MYRQSQFSAVLQANPIEDNKIHPKALKAAPPTCDVASRQAAGGIDFCAAENNHISFA